MIPGGGGMDPRQLKQMMEQLGIEVEEFPDVQEVKITTSEGTFMVEDPSVTKMSAQGEETLQVQGNIVRTEGPKAIGEQDSSEVELDITDEDIELVRDQTGASEEEAVEALRDNGGNPAEAIIALQG